MPIHDWSTVPAGVFHDFHCTWAPEIKKTLVTGLLPRDYYVMVEQVASGPVPDVITLQRESDNGGGGSNGSSFSGSDHGVVTLLDSPPRLKHQQLAPGDAYTARARVLVVRHSSDDRIVAVIEIISPGNKNRRDALAAFVAKAVDFLKSGVHLMVIDLFPPGKHDPEGIHPAIWSQFSDDAIASTSAQPLTLASYASGLDIRSFIQPLKVGDMMPECPLFLTEQTYVNLPLESSYEIAYSFLPRHWQAVLENRSE